MYNFRTSNFEDQLKELLIGEDFGPIRVAFQGSDTLKKELKDNTDSVFPLMVITVAVMCCFTMFAFFRRDPLESKSLFGLFSVKCVLLACLGSFGFVFNFNVPFIGINYGIPFLTLGEL